MELSAEQKGKVSEWVASGESIAKIQNLLKEECSLSMTYMDVRFLVDDLGVHYKDSNELAEQVNEVSQKEAAAGEATIADGTSREDGNENSTEGDLAAEVGSVVVDVDSVIRPGSLVSGTVVFSDGVQLGWQLSSTGQLGLIPGDNTEYRPSNEDLQSFQTQLQSVLQKKGF